MKTIPFNEVKNNLIGQLSTDRRTAYEAKLAKETGPKMKPILFNTPMVNTINEGRKTMTRREFKDQPIPAHAHDGFKFLHVPKLGALDDFITDKAPYKIGDILYVREEHKVTLAYNLNGGVSIIFCEYTDGTLKEWLPRELPTDTLERLMKRKTLGKWQRGRFLPKALARTFLRVTAVKAERLQDISEADAIAEGVENMTAHLEGVDPCYFKYDVTKEEANAPGGHWAHVANDAVDSFCSLWKSINGPDSWDANPYVFAYTFERTHAPHSIPQSSNPSIL